MPFDHCIQAALEGGLIDEDQAEDYRQIYGEEVNARSQSMPPGAAAAEAGRATFAAIEGLAAERRRQVFLQLATRQQIEGRLSSFTDPISGNADPHRAAIGLYSRILPGRNGLAAEQQHEFWRGQAHAHLDGAYDLWSRDWAGRRRNQPRMANVAREAFGESTGDAAAMALAQGWKKSSEMLRQAFNEFGGHIGHLEDWGLPQSHKWRAVREAGFEKWKADVVPALDRNRMVDRRTGAALSDARLGDVLRQVYDSIITRGWASREPTSAAGVKSLANRRDEARVLHFKGADQWLAYQQKYGDGDPINAMFSHIDRMSRDIGLMQVMGPNPNATLSWVKSYLTKLSKTAGDDRDNRYNRILDRLHVNYTRSNSAPENAWAADIIDDMSNLATAAQLGGAIVTAVPTDMNFQRLARGFNGMPQWQALTTYLRRLDPTNPIDRFTAIRLGLGAQHFAQVLGEQGRFIGEIYGHKWSRWIADRSLALSGLTPWTSAGRGGFATDVFLRMAKLRDTAWGGLDKDFAAYMARYGIGAGEWDILRQTPTYDLNSAVWGKVSFLRPADVLERTDLDRGVALDLASKLQDMAQSESEFAVPSESLETRAITAGFDAAGSAAGVAKRSFYKYKNFGLTMLLTHGRRMAAEGTPLSRGAYAAKLIVSSTMAGAVALLAKDILAGKNPRQFIDEPDTPIQQQKGWRFWLNATAQGGGMGPIGDFAYAGLQGDQGGTGQGLTTMLAGPLAGQVSDTTRAIFGSSPLAPSSGNQSPTHQNFPSRMLELTKRNMPGGNTWWARLALERYIWDNLQSGIDPGWQQRVSRIEQFYRKQYGQEFYWHHGESAPSGAPDLSAAVEGSP